MSKLTPKSRKTKKQPICTDVQAEFNKRLVTLFQSFFTTPSIEEIISFPPVAPVEEEEEDTLEQTMPFYSGATDYKLKKWIEARNNENEDMIQKLEVYIDQHSGIFATKPINTEEIFSPERAKRPEKPLYLQNYDKDREHAFETRRTITVVRPLNIPAVEKEFKRRLEISKKNGMEKSQRRFRFIKKAEEDHREFLKTLPKPRTPKANKKKNDVK